jgi:hypothetical protein
MSIPVLIRRAFERCWLMLALQLVAACAQGYASEPPRAIEVPVVDAGHAVFTGEACTIGDRQPCSCPIGGTGLRACVADSTSPTGGALTGCLPCDTAPSYAAGRGASGTGQSSSAVSEPPVAGKPAVSDGGSGGGGRGGGASAGAINAAGKGGSGGAGGSSASASNAAGKGGSGGGGGSSGSASNAAGKGGSGGSTKPAPAGCSSDCAAKLCFPLGVLGCCKSNGTCGCTWAPGAYCM